MKKSTLIMILSLVLAISLGLGGTLAYLTDTDADVNVMTVGRVSVVQNEQQRVEKNGEFTDELVPFVNDKMLLPVTNRNGTTDNVTIGEHELELKDKYNNYIDKIVTATNTSNVDVYLRTFVALPTGIHKESNHWHDYDAAADVWLHWNLVDDVYTHYDLEEVTGDFYITVDGVEYEVWQFTHKAPVAPKETTYPVIRGLFMDKRVDMDKEGYYITLDDGTVHRIGNFLDEDGKMNVLVLTQAVQADGFDSADSALTQAFPYGEDNANVQKWFTDWTEDDIGSPGDKNDTNNPPEFAPAVGDDDEVTFDVPADAFRVTSTAELEAAVADGKTVLLLADGEYNANMNATTGKTLTLYGESKNAVLVSTMEQTEGADYDFDGSTVTFNGLTIDTSSHAGSFKGYARMNGTYNDCVIIGEYCLYGNAEFNYCTLNTSGDIYNIRTWGAPVATFDHCTFNSDGKAMLLYGTVNTKLTLESCLFNDTGVLPDLKAAIEIGDDYGKSYELIVNNTVVNGYEVNDKGIPTGSTLWANKNSMGSDKLNVVLDGVDIY